MNKLKKNTKLISELLLWLVFALLASVLIKNANAESLRDPTRIPSDMPSTTNKTHGVNAQYAGPTLQSIMLSSDIHAAIINGKKVNLGDHYEGAKLVNLTENSATLISHNGSKQVLRMHPSIVKQNNAVRITTK
jgi:hypothetical protein